MDNDLDPAVSRLAAGGRVGSNRLTVAASNSTNFFLRNSVFRHISDDGESTLCGKHQLSFHCDFLIGSESV